jgi:hypothetical protein
VDRHKKIERIESSNSDEDDEQENCSDVINLKIGTFGMINDKPPKPGRS